MAGFLFHEELKLAGLPTKILLPSRKKKWVPLSEFLNMGKYLHFCKGRIATQFCSFSFARDKWIASHDSAQFDAFQKLCDAADYHVRSQFLRFHPSPDDSINIEFYYPLLVLQGDLLEARVSGKRLGLRSVNHLCIRRTVIRNGEELSYNFDVVTEKGLHSLVKRIENEMDKAANQIKRKKPVFQASIRAIYEQTKRLRAPEKIAAKLHL